MKEKILSLLKENKSYNEIVGTLGVSKSTISYHAKRNGLARQSQQSRDSYLTFDWFQIQTYYDSGKAYKECKQFFGFNSTQWDKAVKSGKLKLRPPMAFNDLKARKTVKKRIIKEKTLPYKCQLCGLENTWNGKELVLQLDHINGINDDNRLPNLRFLCPNCHSQTSTFCGRNNKRE